jgi:hypothetical protein
MTVYLHESHTFFLTFHSPVAAKILLSNSNLVERYEVTYTCTYVVTSNVTINDDFWRDSVAGQYQAKKMWLRHIFKFQEGTASWFGITDRLARANEIKRGWEVVKIQFTISVKLKRTPNDRMRPYHCRLLRPTPSSSWQITSYGTFWKNVLEEFVLSK